MTINERIKDLRKDQLNLTLDKFGEKIGLKKSALSLIENGRSGVTDQTVLAICREFGVNETWLRTGEGDPFVERPRSEQFREYFSGLEGLSDKFKQAFADALAELTDDDLKKILEIVREMRRDALKRRAAEEEEGGTLLQAAHRRTDIDIPGDIDTSDDEFFD